MPAQLRLSPNIHCSLIAAFLVLALSFSSSWAECISIAEASWIKRAIQRDCYITGSCTGDVYQGQVDSNTPAKINYNGSWLVDDEVREKCSGGGCYCTDGWRVQCTWTTYRVYKTRCDTEAEADSVACANGHEEFCPQCDSTAWTCETSNEITQTTVSSDNITCFGGECYGTTYCTLVSKTITTCTNECGTTTSQEYELPYKYDGACNEDYTNNQNCGKTKCIEPDVGHYALYQNCITSEVQNGEVGTYNAFVGGGLGSCRSAGYQNEGSLNSSSSGGVDSSSISQECLISGINCPSDSGRVDYSQMENRTAANGCSCETGPGLWYTICPDGSVTADYGKCYYTPPSSSSTEPPPSSGSSGSSSSANPEGGASSGSLDGDWVKYQQGEDIKTALAAIYAKMGTGEGVSINVASQLKEGDIANAVNSVLMQFADDTGGVIPVWNFIDSSFGTLDTNGVLHNFLSRFDTTQNVVDTVHYSGSGSCPTFTFFRGRTSSNAFSGGGFHVPELKFNFGNFFGFNLCSIISAVVKVLSSVVAFFIGWKFLRSMW